jgi:hypothetical protein
MGGGEERPARAGWRGRLSRAAALLRHRQVWAACGVVLGTLVLAKAGPPVWTAMMRVAGRPYCLSYSDIYLYAGGAFQRRGEDWIEIPAYRDFDVSYFDETERTTEYIYLINASSRSNAKVNPITIRLPVCGGVSQVAVQSAASWIDSHVVWR